ncbi:hypothetical protein [Vibrio harveyi]|uniref:hypothetical protein n=1 Tax=Vibrio harveyi TaxID=669 RepID=UPI000D787942|nr:hypothetical protein [Vibrio harveyi]GBK97742.1 hypothetical protein VH1709_contig00011-0070 [Vibrio harveyi]HDM8061698.1 hypothetical protein [Vibrio harveyi]
MGRVTRKGVPLSELRARAEELERFKVFVGWLESARYDDGTPIAGVAAVHEYGSPIRRIPPRPYLRTAKEENRESWKKLVDFVSKQILSGNMKVEDALEMLGLKISGDIKKAIKNISSPALKQKTIANRLRKKADGKTVGNLDKPLIETAIMINSVTYEVKS